MPKQRNARRMARVQAARKAARRQQMRGRRMAPQGRGRRAGPRAGPAATPAVVGERIRRLIARHVAQLSHVLNQNRAGHAAADILASLGAQAEVLQGYLATATALGQAPVVTEAPAPAEAAL